MAASNYKIKYSRPGTADFLRLRSQVGWGESDRRLAKLSLKHSLFHVVVYYGSRLVGMGRVVGDGYMYFYLQDVVVDPDHQGHGVGDLIMVELEKYLSNTARKGSTVGLLAAQGKEGFYKRYGYQARTGDILGLGMSKFI